MARYRCYGNITVGQGGGWVWEDSAVGSARITDSMNTLGKGLVSYIRDVPWPLPAQ